MLWQVRAVLEDRPGALAALAAACGSRSVNILGLQIFPAADGRVVDELVLHTPEGWSAADVERLCASTGVSAPVVAACSAQVLEDQPVRYLRAAQAVVDEPERLEEQLCRLLGAAPAGSAVVAGAETLVLDDDSGSPVRLSRPVAFTDTEAARATELRRLAASMPSVAVAPPTTGEPLLRRGTADDVAAVVAMHERCSAETVYRRYHVPTPRVSRRLAHALLEPEGGCSVVATLGDHVVAVGVLAPDDTGAELGLLVEDGWQRRGIGVRLLRALVDQAAERGLATLTCLVQSDNDAVLQVIHGAGLKVLVSYVDGLTEYRIPVGRHADGADRRRRQAMGSITAPLVSLLHERHELRAVHPAADLIDQAVRGGA